MLTTTRDLQVLFQRDPRTIKIIRQGVDIDQTNLAQASQLSSHNLHHLENSEIITETNAFKVASGLTYLATINKTLHRLEALLVLQQSVIEGPRGVGKTALINQLLLSGALTFNAPSSETEDEKAIKRRRIDD
jgi:putative ribosome biogenesis GTPase RsgA